MQRRDSDSTEVENDMVLMSLTNLQLGLPDVKFMEEEDSGSDSDASEIVTQEKIAPPPPKKQKFSICLKGDDTCRYVTNKMVIVFKEVLTK